MDDDKTIDKDKELKNSSTGKPNEGGQPSDDDRLTRTSIPTTSPPTASTPLPCIISAACTKFGFGL